MSKAAMSSGGNEASTVHPGVQALLAPRAVALIGVSDDAGKMSGNPIRVLAASSYVGALYPVNPKRDVVGGHRAYHTVEAIEGAPEVALIVVPRDAVIPAVEACGRKGVRAAVIISSGFAETGEEGARLQARLAAVACAANVRVVGPNCTGYFTAVANLPLGTSAAFVTGRYRPGSIAFITQSGAIGTALLTLAHERGMGPSLWFSTGNEMDLTVADFMLAAVEDANSRAMILYLESIRNVPAFAAAGRAALEAGKPIIALKVGRSTLGAQKAQAHTGALIGSDAVYSGFFRQLGVIRADRIEHLLPIAALFQSQRSWGTGRVGVVSVSGGLAAYAADLLSEADVDLAKLSPETLARLDATSDLSTPGNPFDPAGQVTSNPQIMIDSVQAFLDDPDVGVLAVVLPFGVHILRVVPSVVADAARRCRKMIVFVRWMPIDYGRAETDVLRDLDVPLFESIDEAVVAIAARTRYERERAAILAAALQQGGLNDTAVPRFPNRVPVLETEARALFAAYGLPSPREVIARSKEEALSFCARLGYPLVLKILSRDIAHKTEAGGVIVGVTGAAAAGAAYERILENVRCHNAAAVIDGVIIQEMAPDGIDVIVGAKHEPGFGPVLMVGMGGVLAEAFSRVAVRPTPISRFDAEAMVDEAGLSPLLANARRGRPSDRAALIEALLGVAKLMADHGERVAELDINPLRVLLAGAGVVALDGLIIAATPSNGSG